VLDADWLYRCRTYSGLSVCLSVVHTDEPCKRWTDHEPVWDVDSSGPKGPWVRRVLQILSRKEALLKQYLIHAL